MYATSGRSRGFALMGAIFALVVIAALVAGAFYAAMMEVNMGRSSQDYRRAFCAAEGGMATRIARWPERGGTFAALAIGDSLVFSDTMPDGRATASTSIRRLNTQLFLLHATGRYADAQRELAAIAKLQLLQMQIRASLTTRHGLRIGGSSYINGANTAPMGWLCPATHDTLAAVRTPDSALIQTSGCIGLTCLSGNPKIMEDGTVNDSTFFSYGPLSWNDLVGMATKLYAGDTGPLNTLAPSGTATTCNLGVTDNWGEPWHGSGQVAGCYDYFPIIHVTGNLKLTGGRGQGILLVDGDLLVDGGFEFYGPVIVRGHFQTQGTGGHFNGGVLSADVDLELNSVLGNAVITYSSCAIDRAIQASANARLLPHRRWVDLVQ